MRNLMIKAQDKAAEIKHLQDEVLPKLKSQLAEVKGIFKDKERKSLTEQIEQTERKYLRSWKNCLCSEERRLSRCTGVYAYFPRNGKCCRAIQP